MNLHMIIFGEQDAFLRGREAVVVDPLDKQKVTTHIVPEKFRDDVTALIAYIGAERFKNGLSIEVSLAELLDVVPRSRKRTDAYGALIKYLKEERDIILTIKTSKKNAAD